MSAERIKILRCFDCDKELGDKFYILSGSNTHNGQIRNLCSECFVVRLYFLQENGLPMPDPVKGS